MQRDHGRQSPPSSPRTPGQVLTTMRVIWAALLLGQVTFFLVILFLLRRPGAPAIDAELLGMLFMISVGMLIVVVPMSFVIRHLVFGTGDGTIAPERFATGHVLFLAALEGVSFLGLVVMLLARELWPFGIVPGVSFLVQLAARFPTASRLRDQEGQ